MPQLTVDQANLSEASSHHFSAPLAASAPDAATDDCTQPTSVSADVDSLTAAAIRLLYLDDCPIDHRLLSAYLRMDGNRSYTVTGCTTLDEALLALKGEAYDALIIDNRIPPFADYHEPYRHLKQTTGYSGPALIISADISGQEFRTEKRQDHEFVLDKADLLPAVKAGVLAQVANGVAPTREQSATITVKG